MILYVGLAMISLGLLITFLGLGEGTSGFKTMEMKLIGPSLVGCGVFFAVLRILFCTVSLIPTFGGVITKLMLRFPLSAEPSLDAVGDVPLTSKSWSR